MAAEVKPLLYSFWRSSCAWRVRIALNLKEIPYDTKPVDLLKDGGHHLLDDFREINPMQQVPALHIDGYTLTESLNIMHYLEETRPQKPLMPKDPLERAKVRAICEIVVSGIQPLQNLQVLQRIGKDKKEEWTQFFINRGFKAIEKLLSTSAGKYCVGNQITLADCCLVPQVSNARTRFNIDMTRYPIIVRIDAELETNPAFRAAHFDAQLDAPSKMST